VKETPASFFARTGARPPASDVSIAGEFLGTSPRPPKDDEACPTLFRDVGPQALAAFLDGTLATLEGPGSVCIFLRDATLPGYSACVEEFGVLVFLQPLSMGPWHSGQEGIWVAERGRMPPPDTLGFVPAKEPLGELDAKLSAVGTIARLREVLGSRAYDERVSQSRASLREYLAQWSRVERAAAPLRAQLDGKSAARREEVLRALLGASLTEKDLRAPWFHLCPERRKMAEERIRDLADRFEREP
jgi:hypothetical protein